MSKRSSSNPSANATLGKKPRLLMEEVDGSISSVAPNVPRHFHVDRARVLTKYREARPDGRCVVLWMFRDQRVFDNYALYYAQSVAQTHGVPLKVVFNIVPRFLGATLRQYDFMLRGLREVERDLRALDISFHLLLGDPVENVTRFAAEHEACLLVADFFPLRVVSGWVSSLASAFDRSDRPISLVQVDAHNIVPCWSTSPKLEYSARTFRAKITPKIPDYLLEIPRPQVNPPDSLRGCDPVDWDATLASLEIDRTVTEVSWITPGYAAAQDTLDRFLSTGLKEYEKRNDPNTNCASNLSPYLHFGQISAQQVIWKLKMAKKQGANADSFVEELVVRRELADNFCFYNPKYDSLEGCYEWARETLNQHRNDPRPYVYTREQLEEGRTHDDLWNAAQIQLLREGKMHGFLRMYWAKKVLEWTQTPEEALSIAIYLNDKYQLDGRDPNGYVGCMWSIGGIHDQGWAERSVFGKIRYMNYQGCQRKFDVKKFVNRYPPAAQNAVSYSGQQSISGYATKRKK